MYQTGDKVVYGNIGVCVVVDISELDFMDNGKEYYTSSLIMMKTKRFMHRWKDINTKFGQ